MIFRILHPIQWLLFFPAAGDILSFVENIDTHEEDIIGFNESLPPSLFIFKTIVDPFVGRESLF